MIFFDFEGCRKSTGFEGRVDGWMDTSVGEDVWDDDAYYTHLDDIDSD